jgi:hypothetical protein
MKKKLIQMSIFSKRDKGVSRNCFGVQVLLAIKTCLMLTNIADVFKMGDINLQRKA